MIVFSLTIFQECSTSYLRKIQCCVWRWQAQYFKIMRVYRYEFTQCAVKQHRVQLSKPLTNERFLNQN